MPLTSFGSAPDEARQGLVESGADYDLGAEDRLLDDTRDFIAVPRCVASHERGRLEGCLASRGVLHKQSQFRCGGKVTASAREQDGREQLLESHRST